jgi:hypothetical protein
VFRQSVDKQVAITPNREANRVPVPQERPIRRARGICQPVVDDEREPHEVDNRAFFEGPRLDIVPADGVRLAHQLRHGARIDHPHEGVAALHPEVVHADLTGVQDGPRLARLGEGEARAARREQVAERPLRRGAGHGRRVKGAGRLPLRALVRRARDRAHNDGVSGARCRHGAVHGIPGLQVNEDLWLILPHGVIARAFYPSLLHVRPCRSAYITTSERSGGFVARVFVRLVTSYAFDLPGYCVPFPRLGTESPYTFH